MMVTGTDSIALGNPMPLPSCLLCATAAEGHSMLSRRDHHPLYPCIGMGWSAGLPPHADCQGSNGLDGTEGKEAKGLCRVDF